MPVFSYNALSSAGSYERGTITADTARQARDELRGQGLAVRRISEQHSASSRSTRFLPRGVHASQIALAAREIATLLEIGVPVTEALDTVSQQFRGRFRTSLMLVRDRVSSGSSLAAAMSEQPAVYEPLAIAMVEVGEHSGKLATVLYQLADFRDRAALFKDRVTTALMYPAIVFIVSLGVTMFLMTVVVPMLLTNLLEMGRPLPWPTRILKHASDILLNYGGFIAVGTGIFVVVSLLALRTEYGRRLWHGALLKVPIVGAIIQKQTLSRVALVMATLLRSGVVFLQALDISTRSTRNVVLREALQMVGTSVANGKDIGTAMKGRNIFPPLVVQLFSVGQESGKLEELLERLAETYDGQVATMSARFAALLEPVLVVILAVLVGFILFATLLPILEAGNVL